MNRWILWLPLGLFGLLFAVIAIGLIKPEGKVITSKMIGKPLPQFALPPGTAKQPGLTTADFRTGQPRLLNIFASWCVPCAIEAPQLAALRQSGAVIEGIAIRDSSEDLTRFLNRNGNPFARIGSDATSSVQIAMGSSGVPETFVVDGRGIIRYQHIGDIRDEDVPMLLQKLKDAQ